MDNIFDSAVSQFNIKKGIDTYDKFEGQDKIISNKENDRSGKLNENKEIINNTISNFVQDIFREVGKNKNIEKIEEHINVANKNYPKEDYLKKLEDSLNEENFENISVNENFEDMQENKSKENYVPDINISPINKKNKNFKDIEHDDNLINSIQDGGNKSLEDNKTKEFIREDPIQNSIKREDNVKKNTFHEKLTIIDKIPEDVLIPEEKVNDYKQKKVPKIKLSEENLKKNGSENKKIEIFKNYDNENKTELDKNDFINADSKENNKTNERKNNEKLKISSHNNSLHSITSSNFRETKLNKEAPDNTYASKRLKIIHKPKSSNCDNKKQCPSKRDTLIMLNKYQENTPMNFTKASSANPLKKINQGALYKKENELHDSFKKSNFLKIRNKTAHSTFREKTIIPKRDIITKPKLSEAEHKRRFLLLMNDPTNPYSTHFTNKILTKQYKMAIAVNRFKHGVPMIKLIKQNRSVLPQLGKTMNEQKFEEFNTNRKNFFKARPDIIEDPYENENRESLDVSGEIQFPIIYNYMKN